ncbi:MAG TPA: hypothetical protein VHC22_24525 [Pirellulales bacterium]|nr:hypothetical protein [Pirellulales bacterium]
MTTRQPLHDETTDAVPGTSSTAPESTGSAAADRRRGGAPARNQNRTTHAIFGIGLPKGTSHIAERLNRLRRELAALVESEHGEVSLYHAAVIDAAVKWERLAQLAGRWLRKEGDKLQPAEKLTFAKEIARAAVERNRAMRDLGINAKAEWNPGSIYDEPVWPAPDAPETNSGEGAPQPGSSLALSQNASNAALDDKGAA